MTARRRRRMHNGSISLLILAAAAEANQNAGVSVATSAIEEAFNGTQDDVSIIFGRRPDMLSSFSRLVSTGRSDLRRLLNSTPVSFGGAADGDLGGFVSPADFINDPGDSGQLTPLFPDWHDMTADKLVNHPREQKFEQSVCAGAIFAATMFSGALAIQITGAARACTWPDTKDGALCARQIFAILRDLAKIVGYSFGAERACGEKTHPCGATVDDMLGKAATIGATAARMDLACVRWQTPGEVNRFSCGQNLERLSWTFGGFVGDITKAMRVCNDHPITKTPKEDYGLCVGYILSGLGYVAASALEFDRSPYECRKRSSGPRCTMTISTGLNSIALGAAKVTDGAQYCGGKNTRCGVDMAEMAASLFEISTDVGNIAEHCPAKSLNDEKCSASILQMTKQVAVVVAKASDGATSCANDKDASIQCGSDISKAFAGFSFVMAMFPKAAINCQVEVAEADAWYKCGRNLDRIGYGTDVMSRSIGAGVANCGLDDGERYIIKPIKLPRRFFT